MIASQEGHTEVVKHLCAVGGERLLMLTDNVSEECVFVCMLLRLMCLSCV